MSILLHEYEKAQGELPHNAVPAVNCLMSHPPLSSPEITFDLLDEIGSLHSATKKLTFFTLDVEAQHAINVLQFSYKTQKFNRTKKSSSI